MRIMLSRTVDDEQVRRAADIIVEVTDALETKKEHQHV